MRIETVIVVLTAVISSTITTRSVPLLHQTRVTLQCLNNAILLEIDLQDIPTIKPSSLHLRNFSCKPHNVTNTRAFFRIPFQGCGTTRGITRGNGNSFITYSNVVENSSPLRNNSRASTVSHELKLLCPFICYYHQKYVITIQDSNENRTRVKQRHEGSEESPSVSNQIMKSSGQAIFPVAITGATLAAIVLQLAVFIVFE